MREGDGSKRYMEQNEKVSKIATKKYCVHSFQRIERKKIKNSFFPSFGNVFFYFSGHEYWLELSDICNGRL